MRIAVITGILTIIAITIGVWIMGSVQAQQPYIDSGTVGNGSLTFSGSANTTLNLSGTASTSHPCNVLIVSVSGTTCLMGTTSGSTTLSVPAGDLRLPASNVNQVWVTAGTATSVGYWYYR